jgi:glycosyltransferase involved in cell wall biosynthesis
MTAFRLYSGGRATHPDFRISLAHGRLNHERYDLFESQHLISPVGMGKWSQIQFIRRARSWLTENARNYDVLHGLQGFDVTVRPAFEAKRLGLPAVVKLANHNMDFAERPGWRGRFGVASRRRKLALELDAIIAISQDIREELLGYGFPESKIAVIPNGVDTHQFHPCADATERSRLRAELGWPDRPTLLFVGRVMERKGPHLLIEALKHIADLQVVLLGPPDNDAYTERLNRTARDLGVEDRVIRMAFTSKPGPAYRAADVFALPSSREGMPNALLEAMATGLPSVVTDISGSRDLVTDGATGRVVKREVDDIARVLNELLSAPAHANRLGEGALSLIRARYSTDAVLGQHLALFHRIRRGGA